MGEPRPASSLTSESDKNLLGRSLSYNGVKSWTLGEHDWLLGQIALCTPGQKG